MRLLPAFLILVLCCFLQACTNNGVPGNENLPGGTGLVNIQFDKNGCPFKVGNSKEISAACNGINHDYPPEETACVGPKNSNHMPVQNIKWIATGQNRLEFKIKLFQGSNPYPCEGEKTDLNTLATDHYCYVRDKGHFADTTEPRLDFYYSIISETGCVLDPYIILIK
ncbi:MAG: hypothetical protein OEZ23_08725 [Gammaproteobacteria bacterium]|nr:hypothetical protein [Gammaproteobacteria bacterium]